MNSLCNGRRSLEFDGLSTVPVFGMGVNVINSFQKDQWTRVLVVEQNNCRKFQNCTGQTSSEISQDIFINNKEMKRPKKTMDQIRSNLVKAKMKSS
jgi:hypothetical protein